MDDEHVKDDVATEAGGEIESRLRAWRPVGPPPTLRARVVAAPESRRVWPWAAAAAALLLGTLGLRLAADAALTQAAVHLAIGTAATSDPAATAIAGLTDALGGDDAARSTATQMVRAEEARLEQQRVSNHADAGMPTPTGDMP
jgi:hypothetical protein